MGWELRVVDTSDVDDTRYLRVMDPMGYEQWMSEEDWDIYITNCKKRQRKENLDKFIPGNND